MQELKQTNTRTGRTVLRGINQMTTSDLLDLSFVDPALFALHEMESY